MSKILEKLTKCNYVNSEDIIVYLQDSNLHIDYLKSQGFEQPILNKCDLKVNISPDNFTFSNLENYVESNKEIENLNMHHEYRRKIQFQDYIRYYNEDQNFIQDIFHFEFSDTNLNSFVHIPTIVKTLCWIENCWSVDVMRDVYVEKPKIEKFCFMGIKNSCVDFQISFGGASFWYHMFKGEQMFYLICPNNSNLLQFQNWLQSSNKFYSFFAENMNYCYQCKVSEGQTIFIPSGWIYAILSLQDSVAFGGYFLHNFNIPLQFRIQKIETELQISNQLSFPMFEICCLLAKHKIYKDLQELKYENTYYSKILTHGAHILIDNFKKWNKEKKFLKLKQFFSTSIYNLRTINVLLKEIDCIENYEKSSKSLLLEKGKPYNFPNKNERQNENYILPLRLNISSSDYSNSLNNNENYKHNQNLTVKFRKPAKRTSKKRKKKFCFYQMEQEQHGNAKRVGPLKLKLNFSNKNKLSNNGIEELLKASTYTCEGQNDPCLDEISNKVDRKSGDASPSTREAIVGMLTMSNIVIPSQQIKPAHKEYTPDKSQFVEENITDRIVYQDEDYKISDDDDYYNSDNRDMSWNPSAPIKIISRKDRPHRHRICHLAIEKGLEKAAKKILSPNYDESVKKRKKTKKCKQFNNVKSMNGFEKESFTISVLKKPRKGLATAKQRLGRKLKINRMLY